MDLLQNLGGGFEFVMGVLPLLTIVAGVCIGILIGAMPGLSPSMGVALLVPFTYPMSPTLALVFLAAVAIPLSLWTIVAAHVVFCLAYVALVVSTRLADLDSHLEEAALDLGATPIEAFIQVLLPQLMPGIISGCLLAFVLSMDDFLIASFTAGSGANTLPMEIFSRIRTGVKPDINALSVILIIASGFLAIFGEYLRSQGEGKRMRN